MDEREEYINNICNNMKERMDEEAKKEAMGEKEKFILAIDKYKNDLCENVENLNTNIKIQQLTISILNKFMESDNVNNLKEDVINGIKEDIDTKQEIVDNAKKAIKIMEYKINKINSIKEFMIAHYEMMTEINFIFDNCLKFNGEYTNKISEFDV